jgi:hypothetical protein
MSRVSAWLPGFALAALCGVLLLTPTSQAGDINFTEDFALAKDRNAALKQLIPGTEDYYYYNALHYLNTEQFDKIDALYGPWHQRHNQTARLTEIQTRQALLTFNKNPEKTLTYLRTRLGLNFDHQKETIGATTTNLVSVLDPNSISRDTLRNQSMAGWGNLDNFEDSALDWLAVKDDLGAGKRRNLLQRLTRPDVAELPAMVVADLNTEHAGEFGYLGIHRQMTLAQLEEVLKLKPSVRNQSAFVQTYITKLQPGADEDWQRDRKLTLAYLERLQKFVDKLDPVHNALKAHVYFHRLAFDRANDVYDKARFMAYIQLPRFQPYMNAQFGQRVECQRHPAHLNADFNAITLLPTVNSDEALVRSYLKQFFTNDGGNTKDYEPYIDDGWLSRLYAETKIELGAGDPEQWASRLPPELFRALKDRIDIDFAFTNKTDYAADEAVSLDLNIKNVPTLLVKVFEVNTGTVYRTKLAEVDTDINLDGLVANSERAVKYEDSPFRRVARKFDFPELNKPGVYVIDFIGAGKSSRALVRKGHLRPLVAVGIAGQNIRIVDDKNAAVNDATVWLGGQEYRPDKDGIVTVPFTAEPGRRPVVISRGDFSCLDYIEHKPEGYRLTAGIHVDRESMLTQKVAQILIRPGLFLNDTPVSLKLLEDVKLHVTAIDNSDIPTSTEVPNFMLFEDRESIHEIRVPARLKSLTVTLTAKVKNMSTGKPVELGASKGFALNGIELTDKIEDLHLARFGSGYVIELLGRTGEAKPDRPVQLSFKHRDFKTPVNATLKTDPMGRVVLGPLTDIATVTATGPEGTAHTWNLSNDAHTFRSVIHAKAGEPIALPYLGNAAAPTHEDFALFEVRGSDIRVDRFAAIAVQNGVTEIRGLAAGDYDLYLKRTGEKIRIRVVDGVTQYGFVLGTTRQMQLPGLKPTIVESVTADNENVTIKLHEASKFARVHIFATRYQPAFNSFADLARVRDAELGGVIPGHADSVYLTGRNIGDEYRYVLDRKGQKKYPGNMLERPMLLLNPWAVRTTETGEQLAVGGDVFAPGGNFVPPAAVPTPTTPPGDWAGQPPGTGDFANLDFLSEASAVAVNMIPDKNGVIKLTRKELGQHAMIHIVAVDPLSTTARSIALPEAPVTFVDLRLKNGMDPARHYTQQKQVSIVQPGREFVLADVVGSRFQAYDSLAKVYSFYSTLSKNPTLTEFGFILTWPKLKIEEKRTLYSKYACHELNYFLSKKDPQFFAEVVKPYLRNKKDKTFLDHFLLGDEITRFMQPWEYGRLNTVERVLLSEKLPGEPDKAARHLNDMLRLLPPNTDRQLFLFNVGVDSGGLDTDDAVTARVSEAKNRLEDQLKQAGRPAPGDDKADPGRAENGSVPTSGAGTGIGGAGTLPAPGPAGGPGGGGRPGNAEAKRDGRGGKGADKDAKDPKEWAAMDDRKRAEPYFENDLGKRETLRRLYRKLDPTMEWAENNYYKIRMDRQLADLVPVADFWYDFAQHDGKSPFLSRNLGDAARNFTEMMFALSVLDLPFEAGKHDVKFDAGRMTMTPGGHMIAFHEEVRPADGPPAQLPILISENFYRNGDRFREENGEKYDKFVTGEFVVHTVYGCQIVVTNPTSSRQKLSVLYQLPVGAIPVLNGQMTRSVPLDLEPYRTHTIDYAFYFPKPGKFAHFPVHVAKNEQFVTSAQATVLEVVLKPTKIDTTSWDYVSQNGTNDEVLAFMNRENVRALNLDKIAFRMKERPFFELVTRLLQERHMYQPTLWSYGVFHGDVATARQFLMHSDQLVNECGGPIDSPLLTIDAVARNQYEHLEYKPLVNARAHSLGNRRQIVNDAFLAQYHKLLKTLTYQKDLDDSALLATVYYLLLQDRIEEAIAAFSRVNVEKIATKMQYDYCAAYLEMFKDEPVKARAIATPYLFHPVDRWRNTFAAIVAQVDEIEGKGVKVVPGEEHNQNQGGLAATEPGFEVTVNAQGVNLTFQNIDTVRVNYYLMDVELLFSTSPFVQKAGAQFATIKPNGTNLVKLPAGRNKHTFPLPADFEGRNVLVEVTAAGKTRTVSHFASTMTVNMSENYGQLQVTETAGGKSVSKVYVKVYAKLADGSVKFHKDGYTDLRGRFDYSSVNTPERQAIDRFAILVLSDDRGAVIRDVAPPQR